MWQLDSEATKVSSGSTPAGSEKGSGTNMKAFDDMRAAVRAANAAPDADPSDLLDAVFARA